MRKIYTAVACAVGALLIASTAQAQQEISITVAAGQPLRAMRPLQMVSDFYIPEVEKRIKAANLNIKINWKEAYAGSLLKPTFVLKGVQDGIADIGFEPTIFHPDRLPLEQISFMTPFATSDVVMVGKAIDKLHATFPEFRAQYDKFGVIRLAGSSYDSYELFSTFPVQKFDDIKGKKISTAGAALQWMRGTPATPVSEQHDALLQQRQDRRDRRLHHLPVVDPGHEVPGGRALRHQGRVRRAVRRGADHQQGLPRQAAAGAAEDSEGGRRGLDRRRRQGPARSRQRGLRLGAASSRTARTSCCRARSR